MMTWIQFLGNMWTERGTPFLRIALIHGAKHFPVYTTYKIALLNQFLPSATLPLASP